MDKLMDKFKSREGYSKRNDTIAVENGVAKWYLHGNLIASFDGKTVMLQATINGVHYATPLTIDRLSWIANSFKIPATFYLINDRMPLKRKRPVLPLICIGKDDILMKFDRLYHDLQSGKMKIEYGETSNVYAHQRIFGKYTFGKLKIAYLRNFRKVSVGRRAYYYKINKGNIIIAGKFPKDMPFSSCYGEVIYQGKPDTEFAKKILVLDSLS